MGTESKTASSPIRAKERTSLLQTTRRVCHSLGGRVMDKVRKRGLATRPEAARDRKDAGEFWNNVC
jgi:hypothetical protein